MIAPEPTCSETGCNFNLDSRGQVSEPVLTRCRDTPRPRSRAPSMLSTSPGAHRYLAEGQYRFSRRRNLAPILARLLRAASLTLPRPARLIRLAKESR